MVETLTFCASKHVCYNLTESPYELQEPETVWNAFRFGTISLLNNHKVKIFLLRKGVKSENIRDEKFNVQEQIKLFVENNGKIFACGTCLKTRQMEGREFVRSQPCVICSI